MESFKATGYWFVSDDPEHRVAGTLKYSPHTGILLSLSGVLQSGDVKFQDVLNRSSDVKYPLIHGIVNKSPYGKQFTLRDAYRSGISLNMPGFPTERIRANHAFVGDSVLAENDLTFVKASVRFSRLFDWLGGANARVTAIKGPQNGISGVDIHYEKPESYSVDVGFAKITFHSTWSLRKSKETTVLEERSIEISQLPNLSEEEILKEYISPLQDFLTFSVGKANAIDQLTVYSESEVSTEGNRRTGFTVLFLPIYVKDETPLESNEEMFLRFGDVRDDLGTLLSRWMKAIDEFNGLRSYFNGIYYTTNRYIDEKFLIITDALISIFSATGNHLSTVDDAHRLVLECCKPNQKGFDQRWLSAALPTKIEMRFPWDLLSTIEKFKKILSPIIPLSNKTFVDQVIQARRAFSRRDTGGTSHTVCGEDLFWMNRRLQIVLSICLLEWLGVSPKTIESCIIGNNVYSHLVRKS